MSLKQQKEDFVSGLLGGSISEIYYVTCIALTAYLAFNLIKSHTSYTITFPLDFALNCLVILCAITIYSSQILKLHILVIAPAVLVACIHVFKISERKLKAKSKKIHKEKSDQLLVKKPFITAYRSQMIIITNLAILAVDFKVFPRRFAKVETWGTSMMDLGVGSFVFSMGLANSRSIIKQLFHPSNPKYEFKVSQYIHLITRNTYKALPILLLGFIRLLSVKGLQYQEHVTEYGIHWNFFMTLGFMPIFVGILDPILNIVPRILVAFSIAVGYELLLSKTELMTFILRSDNRFDSIISMNKEGIFSFIGYLSIFLFGQSFGSFVLTDFKTPNNLISMSTYSDYIKSKKSNFFTVSTTSGLIIATMFYQFVFWYIQESFLFTSISRRLCNLSYVMWVVSYNATMMLGYNFVEIFFQNKNKESFVLNSINNNGLAIFLLSNLLTGLINMTINTLQCSDIVAFGILVIYAFAFTVAATFLDSKGIYIKL